VNKEPKKILKKRKKRAKILKEENSKIYNTKLKSMAKTFFKKAFNFDAKDQKEINQDISKACSVLDKVSRKGQIH
jgi:ribosomal protein S20